MTNRRDPDKVGWGNVACFALQADEPPDSFYLAAIGIEERLRELGDLLSPNDRTGGQIVLDARVFAIAIAELLNEAGTSEIFARVGRRKRGKPPEASKMERARRGHRAAAIVMRLVGEGWKQEAAMAEAIAGFRQEAIDH
jgi:hypothetical protein